MKINYYCFILTASNLLSYAGSHAQTGTALVKIVVDEKCNVIDLKGNSALSKVTQKLKTQNRGLNLTVAPGHTIFYYSNPNLRISEGLNILTP